MTTSAEALASRLALRDPDLLRAVLEASGVSWLDVDGAPELAQRLVKALWWRTHSPAGQLARPDSLEGLVDRYAAKLEVHLPAGDVWTRLQALARAVVPGENQPLRLDALDASVRERLKRPVWGRLAGATGSGGAIGAGWLARRVLAGMGGPIWALLARLPYVGPAVVAVRSGAGTVLSLSGPVGIALALWTLNSLLGPRDDRGLPLLVGAALVLRDLPATVPEGGGSAPVS